MEFFTDIFVGLITIAILAAGCAFILWCSHFTLFPYIGGGLLLFFIAWAIGLASRGV